MPVSICQRAPWVFAVLLFVLAGTAHASVAMLLEESYGTFGAFAPTGHAAVYLNHICAETPTRLRMCKTGEFGVVISRYHKIHGYDWIAIPLVPYLYAVEDPDDVPLTVDQSQVDALRDAYRRSHLESLAPDTHKGKTPGGTWVQLVGSSYDRTIHGFQVESTSEQDERFIAIFNDKHNVSHFNIFYRNCADFSRGVLNLYFPDAIHRSIVADLGMTSPKQVAKSFVAYGRKHEELETSAFIIPQVDGSMPRSHAVRGIAESLLKSKKYLLPLTVINPGITGGMVVAYLAKGRMDLPKDPVIFNVDDAEIAPGQVPTEAPAVAVLPAGAALANNPGAIPPVKPAEGSAFTSEPLGTSLH